MGGIAATDSKVIWGGRDALDTSDVFICADALTGQELWRLAYPASPPPGAEVRNGRLDYGNSPRATPLIVNNRVITVGAFGDVHCLDLETGKRIWSFNYLVDFEADLPIWGFSGCPMVVGDRLIVQPGGKIASLAAVRLSDGESIWETPGDPAGYASPVLADASEPVQVVVSDSDSFGGWDVATGRLLWDFKPGFDGEFLVPTPVLVGEKVLFIGEANGARLHSWNSDGTLNSTPVATSDSVTPDTSTPVVVGDSVVVAQGDLYALDKATLQETDCCRKVALGTHTSLISDGNNRVLAFSESGELHLFQLAQGKIELVASTKLTAEEVICYSHPALSGDRLYVRLGKQIACFRL